MVGVGDLKPNPENPNKHPEKQIDLLAEMIKAQGWRTPITVSNRSGFIVRGHGRYYAALALAEKKAPVDFQDYESDEEEWADLLADNKIAEKAYMDDVLTESLIKKINSTNVDFNFQLTGFDESDILRMLGESNRKKTPDDETPKKPKKTNVKIGDLYRLGNHMILCGDSTKMTNIKKIMAKNEASMIFTDPPYNVNYSGRGKKTSAKILNDNMYDVAFRLFLHGVFSNCYKILRMDGALYSCYASRTHREFEDSLILSGFEVINQIIWVKSVSSMGWGNYRWQHEPILYCRKRNQKVKFYGARKEYTVWEFEMDDRNLLLMAKLMLEECKQDETTVWRFNRDSNYQHPTQKPVDLISKAIINNSRKNEIVFDPFLGSGSTLIACEKLGRICFGIELDPKFIDVIINRFENYTGIKAKKAKKS
jgi:DNA modification methylase